MGEKFDSLLTMPGLSELPENERNQVLLAMLIQNATHQKNADRILAHSNMEICEFETPEAARIYMEQKLEEKLKQELKKEEAATVNDLAQNQIKTAMQNIFLAPDVMTAVAIMKKMKLFHGRGDFKEALETLIVMRNPNFKFVAEKLAILKLGVIFKKGVLPDVN